MTQKRWDSLSVEDRATLLRRSDPTMDDPRWEPLIDRMSNSQFDDLTAAQKAVVEDVL